MKLKFVISKLYNHFHFVQNMSEWSEYARKQENRDWTAATEPLTKEEETVLAQVKKFFMASGYGHAVGKYRNIFEFFAVAEQMPDYRAELNKLIGEKDTTVLLEAMGVFKHRFEQIWAIQRVNFDQKYPIIQNNLRENEIKKDIEKIFDITSFPKEINAYLVINTKEYASGGANIGDGRITLECSSSSDTNDIMTIFWHEAIHIISADYVKETFELVRGKGVSREFVNEVIAHSLFGTFGVLSHKYFPVQKLVETKKMVDDYLETGETSESGKRFIDNLPFGLGPYYMAEFIEENLSSGETISIKQMAKEILEVHKKA